MRCISPIRLKTGIFVPCGRCNFCLQRRRLDWSFRLEQENKISRTAQFLTLTYDEDHYPGQLVKEHIQLFYKKLRKENEKHRAHSYPRLRHYTAGEYGPTTGRAHYHSILFNVVDEVSPVAIQRIWENGKVDFGKVTPASVAYVTKYVINRWDDYGGKIQPPFSLMSKRLGASYLSPQMVAWHKHGEPRDYTQVGSIKRSIPRYYRDQLFNKAVRAHLASKLLDTIDEKYWADIAYIAKFNLDPEVDLERRIRHAHDLIKTKANANSYL